MEQGGGPMVGGFTEGEVCNEAAGIMQVIPHCRPTMRLLPSLQDGFIC